VTARLAQVRRDARLEDRRFHRLKKPELLGAPQPAGVDRDQHVRGAALALAADALDQGVFAGLDAVHLDAGGFGKSGVERLVGLVMARRIDIDYLVLREHRAGNQQGTQGGAGDRKKMAHGVRWRGLGLDG
jgi:hypothetical protein